MARIRTIKPEFWQDEKLAPLDPLTRLVFLGLISQADDAGRLVDSVRLIDGLLFPMTDDTCAEALVKLHDLGVIERGVTASGQRVIQIVNWDKHQKVEKPNLKSALDPIVIADTSAKRRRSVPPALRMAIIERDGGVCQECGVEVKVYKDDRYDSDPRLAEIDHIIPVADGGTNDPQNLRLLCLACNRKKVGEYARRRFAEKSAKLPRNVVEASPTHTNDQRSTTEDHRSTTDENDQDQEAEEASGPTPTHAREESPPPAAAADVDQDQPDHSEHVQAMRRLVEEVAHELPTEAERRRLRAELELIVTGDDVAAWRDNRGDPVPWEDRPRLLRLALRRWELDRDQYPKPRSALLYVIAQQYDPFARPTGGMSVRDEIEHYERHRDSAARRIDSEPTPISGLIGVDAPRREDEGDGRRAQEWAQENPERFREIVQEIVEAESLDMSNTLHRIRAIGLALQRVRDEILATEPETEAMIV